jgi:hypothetical protein
MLQYLEECQEIRGESKESEQMKENKSPRLLSEEELRSLSEEDLVDMIKIAKLMNEVLIPRQTSSSRNRKCF